MICVKCETWLPDRDGDFCDDCQATGGDEFRQESGGGTVEVDPTDLKTQIIQRYTPSDSSIKVKHLPGCSRTLTGVCTCGFLMDLGHLGSSEASQLYFFYRSEVIRQADMLKRIL